MNNIQAYNKIAKSKKVSELFLGTLRINWNFAKIGYTATCTESLPMTLMEKMVCGIANLDGRVYLRDLAHIMGLNIENDVLNLKFQDMGETEILMETLRNLMHFGVIVTPDDSFSYIELTEIGKEYYAKGRKFKHGETKGFTMYYDLTAGNHSDAKSLFSKITVDGKTAPQDVAEFPYSDESFVKQYAESQIPQYYNKEIGNSFTDMFVTSKEFLYKEVVLGVIYDSFTENYRFEIIDNGGINADYISDHINLEENYERYLNLFLIKQHLTHESKKDSQIKFEEDITKIQSDAEYAIFSEKPEVALQIVADYATSPDYMEKQNIFNFIKASIKADSINDIFISLPHLTKEAEQEISRLAEDENTRIMLSCCDIKDSDSRFGDRVLSLNGDVDAGVVLIMNNAIYRCEDLFFSINDINFSVEFLHKEDGNSEKTLEQIRDLYAARFIPGALDKYEELLLETGTEDICDRITELKGADNLIMFGDSYVESTGYVERLAALRAQRDAMVLGLVEKYSADLMEELESLRANTTIEEIMTLSALEKVQKSFDNLKDKLIPEQSRDNEKYWGDSDIIKAFNDSISSFEYQLANRENYLRQELLPKNYIIDTNVFVYFPEIMDYIGREDRIILSLKVLDELDKLKVALGGKEKQNVKKAIKEINYKIRMKSKTFRMEAADTRLLPEEFDKTNPDNLILSVALKYSDSNPFLITNDINFQNRAAALGIPFKGLADILPEDVYQSIDFPKPKEKKEFNSRKAPNNGTRTKESTMPNDLAEIVKKAYISCTEDDDEVLLVKFAFKIKEIDQRFKPTLYGYPKLKDLCAAYPSEIELYKNSDNELCIKLIKYDKEVCRNSPSGKKEDLKSLTDEQQAILKELLIKMISEEAPSLPTSDGEIRKAFTKITGIHIKLKPVIQLRESLGIPSVKQRKNNYTN